MLLRTAALCVWLLPVPRLSDAAESWGGSFAATSDYLVRGISRSDHDVALQADVHVATDSGFIGGVFASSIKFDSQDRRSAEFSAFLGFAWQPSSDWRAKVLASYYGYAWNDSGSQYNYAEVAFEGDYDDWLNAEVIYSPDAPRYVSGMGLTAVDSETADLTLHTPWRHRVAATAGLGYSRLGGPKGGVYAYWSAGAVMDLAPWSISLTYVNTSPEAAALFYSAVAHNRWTATLIWRF